jgi:sugar phosphate isomerase/epimerase
MIKFSYIIINPLSTFESAADIQRCLAFLKECGYDGVEINLTDPLGVSLSDLKSWIDELGLVIPSFLTGEAYSEGLCLSSSDAAIREQATQRLIGYLDTVAEFNAILVVGLMQGLRRDEPDPRVANQRIVECLRRVADAAERNHVEFVIEPVNHLQVGFNNSVAEVRQLITTIGSPAIRPMVDTIHMNIEEASLAQPIRDCGAELRHVHLCESNGAHFGSGHIDFGRILQTLDEIGYDGFASVKVYREPLEDGASTALEYLKGL